MVIWKKNLILTHLTASYKTGPENEVQIRIEEFV